MLSGGSSTLRNSRSTRRSRSCLLIPPTLWAGQSGREKCRTPVKNNVRPKELQKSTPHRTHPKQHPDRAIRPSGDSSQSQARETHPASAFVMILEFCRAALTVRPQVKAEPQEIYLRAARKQESLPSGERCVGVSSKAPRETPLAFRP